MVRIGLFAEDAGHEELLRALIVRIARERSLRASVRNVSVRGGHGAVIAELRGYVRELELGQAATLDLLVVATDSNCKGFVERKREIDEAVAGCPIPVVLAIPDPHVERWLLLDSAAFRIAVGRGCDAPDYKCDRHKYKDLLLEAVRAAGVTPLLGGIEHAKAIADAMRLPAVERADPAFRRFLRSLRQELVAFE